MSTSHNAFLPPDLRELIEADRCVADPSEAVRQDVARRVDRALGLGGAMLVGTPPAVSKWGPAGGPPAVAPAAVGIAVWKIAVGVAVVALAGGGGFAIASRQAGARVTHDPPAMSLGASQSAQAMVASPVANTAASPVSLDLDAPLEATTSRKALSPSSERARPPRATDRLADERKLLDRARSALVRRDAAEALSALSAHQKSFAHGQLVEEREGMRVQALVLSHDFGSARAAGERFRKAFAHSMFLPVVDKALESAR